MTPLARLLARRIALAGPLTVAEFMAEALQDRYVFSWKPNPSHLAMPTFNEDLIRNYVRDVIQKTKGCRLEIVMKDNHTICNEPERLVRWVQIVREEIGDRS